jgi:hypothetical protein
MTLRRMVHGLGRLLSAVVLITAGTYVFVYLVRWEWNRALIAGLFLLAAEVFLIADVILGRIGALSPQAGQPAGGDSTEALIGRVREARPETSGPFAWLAPRQDRLTVLLPILIGAGVLLSAVSYLVEQVSRVTALPVAEDELARGLATMALPAGGLAPLGRRFAPMRAPVPAPTVDREGVRVGLALGGFVAIVIAVVTAGLMLLLSVPAPADPGRATQVDLLVLRRDLAQPERDVAQALWSICSVRIPQEVDLAGLEPSAVDDPRVLRMTLVPSPGESDTKEFVGCVQDAIIERVRADVLAVSSVDR